MRQVTIRKWGARTASGRPLSDYTIWGATEGEGINRKVLAYSKEKERMEKLFPTAHDPTTHYINNSGNCVSEGCWRNPHTSGS